MATITADEFTPGLPERVMKKAQWRILPIFFISYLIAYIDRVNIGFAAETMNADLGFSATVYGIGAGMFFAAYASLEIPSMVFMQRVGPRRWIARIMVTWGLVSAAMMFVQTPVQFYIMRFLLGAAEAGFFPAVIYYLSTWIPVKWRGRAVSRFYIGVPLASTVMGLVSAPILALDGGFGLHGWQWLLLLEGLPAVVMGLIVLVLIPDTPATVDWLDADERNWLQTTLAADAARIPATGHSGIWRAITNPVVLLFGGFAVFALGFPQAFSLSAPQILAVRAGLDIGGVGWLITAGGLSGAMAMLANSWFSDRTGNRFWHIVMPLLIMSTGLFVIGTSATPLVVMAGYLCMVAGSFGYQAVYPTYVSQSIPARDLGVGYAMVNSIAQTGAFFAPILFGMAKDATGSYDFGLGFLPLSPLIAIGFLFFIRRRIAASAGHT